MSAAGKLSLSYPGWQHDKEEAERLFIDHSIGGRFHEKIIAMRTRQRLHEGDRSHPHLRTLDMTYFDYHGWADDKAEAERRLAGDCSNLQLGSYSAFYKRMLKKQSLSSDRSSIGCLRDLDSAQLSYPGWPEDKAAAEKIYTDYLTPVRFYEKLKAMKNKEKLHLGDRTHPEIVAFDNSQFSYENSEVDRAEFLQRHTGDCSVMQLGISCDFLFRRMQKKQLVHEGSRLDDALKDLHSFPFTYPESSRDKQTAEQYYANFSSTDRFQAKFAAMKNKQRLHDGDRTHPDIRALDSIDFTYEGVSVDKEAAIRVHTGDCTVLQLGTFEAAFQKMKKKQDLYEKDSKRPGLGDLDVLLPGLGGASSTKGEENVVGSPIDECPGMEKKCVVCLEESPTHAFIPCGHLCLCEKCAGRVSNVHESSSHTADRMACPMCRQAARMIVKIIA